MLEIFELEFKISSKLILLVIYPALLQLIPGDLANYMNLLEYEMSADICIEKSFSCDYFDFLFSFEKQDFASWMRLKSEDFKEILLLYQKCYPKYTKTFQQIIFSENFFHTIKMYFIFKNLFLTFLRKTILVRLMILIILWTFTHG